MITNKQIEEARKKLEEICANEELVRLIRGRQIAEWEHFMDLKNAKEEGIKENQLEIAKSMLEKNMHIDLICKTF